MRTHKVAREHVMPWPQRAYSVRSLLAHSWVSILVVSRVHFRERVTIVNLRNSLTLDLTFRTQTGNDAGMALAGHQQAYGGLV